MLLYKKVKQKTTRESRNWPSAIDLLASFYAAEQKAGVPSPPPPPRPPPLPPPQELNICALQSVGPLVSPLLLDLLLPGQQEAPVVQMSGRMKQQELRTCAESHEAPGVRR